MEKNVNFIEQGYIESVLHNAKNATSEDIEKILKKASNLKGLTHQEIAVLLHTNEDVYIQSIYNIAENIKKAIYGNRIVVFAPLYVSNYCVNNCVYCGYKRDNKFKRRKLTMEEISKEVLQLEKMGHKRLALEVGEDPLNCDIDYVVNAVKRIYSTQNDNGSIRRINVNIAATTVENYAKLKECGIGTYILFQETYHKPTYEIMHPNSLKSDYEYHLTAFDRAIEAGLEDVGGGVLFGLADPYFEVLALTIHNEYLEKKFNFGFHTISVPRLQKAEGVCVSEFPNLVDDKIFKKIVAILRLAVPYTGIILSTRETTLMRQELIRYGVSQISAGSCTGVGGYSENSSENITENENAKNSSDRNDNAKTPAQFETGDNREPLDILKDLLDNGYIPSYCTACYRMGRTGDRFMALAKSGQIHNVCTPNALFTLMEFALDYGDSQILEKAQNAINKEIESIEREDIKNLTKENIEKLKAGKRDLYL